MLKATIARQCFIDHPVDYNRCMDLQVAVRAELHMLPSAQKQEVLQSLLQHVLLTLSNSLQQQLTDVSIGGLLQLLLELQYLHAALTAYISTRLEADFVKIGAVLTQRIQHLHDQAQDEQAAQLDSWMSKSQGSSLPQQVQAGLAQALKMSGQMQQLNLRALQT